MKKIIAIGIIGIFLLTCISTVSAVEISKTEEVSIDTTNQNIYIKPQYISITGKGWGVKSFPLMKPAAGPYIMFLKLQGKSSESSPASYLYTVTGKHVEFEEGNIIIVGSAIGLLGERQVGAGWLGFVNKRGLIGGPFNVLSASATSPLVVIFL